MPGRLEQMLQLHTRLRYKAVFTFQVASISSSPSPSQSPGICRNKPGINSFLFPYRVFACDVMAAMLVYLDKGILNIFF